jgi:hypothetical protein
MVKLYTSGLIYKVIVILLLTFNVLFSEEYVELLGDVVVDNVYILEKPHIRSKKINRLYKGQTVILSGEYKGFYRVKINNYSDGYVPKKYIEPRDALKKDKESFALKRLQYNLKDLLMRFDDKLLNSIYYKKDEVIPYVSLLKCNLDGEILTVDLSYGCKNSHFIKNKLNDDLNGIMKKLIEVIFFNMIEIKANEFYINIYTNNLKIEKQQKPFVTFKYDVDEINLKKLRLDDVLFDELDVNRDKELLFKKCP